MQALLTEEKKSDISDTFKRDAKYLTFELSGEEYGLDVLKVKEIISMVKITPVPKTPEYVKGIVNLRGKVIPIIDLRLKMGVREAESSKDTCIIIVETHNVLKGIIVDMVSEVLNIRNDDMEPSPQFKSGINTNYFLGIAKIKGKLKLLLNIDTVLGTDVQKPCRGKNNPISENKKNTYSTNNDDKKLEKNESLMPETCAPENISSEDPEDNILPEDSKAIENIEDNIPTTQEIQTDSVLSHTTGGGEPIEPTETKSTEDVFDLNATEETQEKIVLTDTTGAGETIEPNRTGKEDVVVLNVIAGVISNDIKEATTSLFETMIMMEMKFKEYSLVDETKIKSDVVCMISFTGKYHGIVSLFCSKELALQIASNMLMEKQTRLTTEVKDAVGEILNMIAGSVKTKIAEKYGETYLSIPLVIVGEDISVSVTETPEISYKTTVVCFTKDPWITTSFSYNNEIMTVGLLLKKTIR